MFSMLVTCRHLSAVPGMNSRIRELLSQIEPDLRGRLSRWIIEISVNAQQAALDSSNRRLDAEEETPDISETRVGSPPPESVSFST